MAAPAIFVNYRRDDAAPEAMLLRDAVRHEFGEDFVFMDTSSLQAGDNWPAEIEAALHASRALLAVMGPDWLRAGSDEWGRRRIDQETDWVRRELVTALSEGKRIIPVLVRGGKMPPVAVLPEPLQKLVDRQAISIRRDYFEHDVKLLLAQITSEAVERQSSHEELGVYPQIVKEGPEPIAEDKLERILGTELDRWKRVVSPLPEDSTKDRVELFREFKFKSFQDAIQFMSQVAPGCDIADHHPRWENIWKTVRVYLTTWDIGHRPSDRDLQLARYFDSAYQHFPGAAAPARKDQSSERSAEKKS